MESLPFTPEIVEMHGSDLMKCGLYRMLPSNEREFIKADENSHMLTYLHMLPLEKIGMPKFYPELSRRLKDIKHPNLIYPVGNGTSIHIYPDKTDIRDYYIPIEPILFQEMDELLLKVEEALVDVVDVTEVTTKDIEERKVLLEDGLEKVCTINGNEDTGNGNDIHKLINRFFKHNGNRKIYVTPDEFNAIKYITLRDKIGMGILEPLIQDPYIEDITCSGLGTIFIEHKIFRGLKTTITFEEMKDLDSFIVGLSEKIRKPVTYRDPIVDAVLPDGSRINIVFGDDISKRGSNFSIRKFSETPLSILELIGFGTIDYKMAAYLWILLEEGMNCFIAGETASGKTTMLNALTTFLPLSAKVVSIEDTPELQIPQKNWTREVTRSSKKESDSDVSMFDLLKAALRQRPNEIIIGEIRGTEGNVAFQAMQCVSNAYILQADGGLLSIKELFEKSKEKYCSIMENRKEVVKLDPKINSWDYYHIFSEDGEAKIEAVYRMPASELIKIETDDGLRLKVTKNHRFICSIDGKIEELKAEEILLKKKDNIFIYKPKNIEIKSKEKNLWDFIDACDKRPNIVKDEEFKRLEQKFRSMHKFYIKEIADAIVTDRKKIEDYFKSRSEVISWDIYKYLMSFFKKHLPDEIKFRFKGAKKDIVLNKELKEILYFLGIFFIRGKIQRDKIILEIPDRVVSDIKLPLRKDKKAYFIKSSFLTWIISDVFGLVSKDIPDTILKLNNDQLSYFVKGLTSCAEDYILKTKEPLFWYGLGRLIGDDSLYASYKNGRLTDYRWQIKNANADEGIRRWAEDAKKIIPNHAKKISTKKDGNFYLTRICNLDMVFVDYLIKNGFIESQHSPSNTTFIKHIPYNKLPGEMLGPYLAGWFDSDWTIRKGKNRGIEIRCALNTSRDKGEVLVIEQIEFISYLVSKKILPAIMGIEIRYHPVLKVEAGELAAQIKSGKLRLNEYKKGTVGIGMHVEFRSNKKEFSDVFRWWKENIMQYMFRMDKIKAINELFEEEVKCKNKILENIEDKILVIERDKAKKLPFIFRDKCVKMDLLPEKDEKAILYLKNNNNNLTKVVNVKTSDIEVTYDISMDHGRYYIGGNYNICFIDDTGHPVMSTFHAASVEKLIQRLTGDPINVPKTYIDNLNLVVIQNMVDIPNKGKSRRITSINEIVGFDSSSQSFTFIETFRWDASKDRFDFTGHLNSYLLEDKIAPKLGIPQNERRKIYSELERRTSILKKIHNAGVTGFHELFSMLIRVKDEGIK